MCRHGREAQPFEIGEIALSGNHSGNDRHFLEPGLAGEILTCMERAAHDETAAAILAQGLETIRDGFRRALENARDAGEVGEMDVEQAAALLTSQIGGLSVLAKAGSSAAQLTEIAESAIAMVVRSAQ